MGKHNKQAAVSAVVEAAVETPVEAAVEGPVHGPQTLAEAEAAELAELQAQLAAAEAEKEARESKAWESKRKLENPQLVLGTRRKATEADLAEFARRGKDCHGVVCEIECLTCKRNWLINIQDSKQVRYCEDHKADGRKARAKSGATQAATDKKAILRKLAKLNAEAAKATPVETEQAAS